MRQNPHIICTRHRRNIATFAKPTCNTDIGLHNIQCPLLNQLAKRPTPGQPFCACNAYRQRTFYLQIPAHIIRWYRLFIPEQIIVCDLLPHIDGSTHIIPAIGIHCKQHIGTYRLPNCRYIFDIVSRAKSDFHFHRRETHIDIPFCLIDEYLCHIGAVFAK